MGGTFLFFWFLSAKIPNEALAADFPYEKLRRRVKAFSRLLEPAAASQFSSGCPYQSTVKKRGKKLRTHECSGPLRAIRRSRRNQEVTSHSYFSLSVFPNLLYQILSFLFVFNFLKFDFRVSYERDTKIINAASFTTEREEHTIGNILRMYV